MAIKMKGLLKGLRYISTIFDEKEEESEMQIGLPTNVKHVAHIGYDGSAANNPSWIENFKEESGRGTTTNGDQQTAADPQSLGKGAPVESPPRRKSDEPKKSSASTGSRNKTDGEDTTSSKPSTRRKKPKSGSSSGQSSWPSTRGRRTKGKDTCQGSVLKVLSDREDQKKSLDEIPRGIQAI